MTQLYSKLKFGCTCFIKNGFRVQHIWNMEKAQSKYANITCNLIAYMMKDDSGRAYLDARPAYSACDICLPQSNGSGIITLSTNAALASAWLIFGCDLTCVLFSCHIMTRYVN
jgi:hypothetical protein